MARHIFLLILVSSLMINPFAYAQEESLFIYDDSNTNDPFIPLVTKDGRIRTSPGIIKSISDVILEGIIYDPAGNSVVVLNGLVLRENDIAGKVRVKKIDRESVILLYNGKDYQFKLKE